MFYKILSIISIGKHLFNICVFSIVPRERRQVHEKVTDSMKMNMRATQGTPDLTTQRWPEKKYIMWRAVYWKSEILIFNNCDSGSLTWFIQLVFSNKDYMREFIFLRQKGRGREVLVESWHPQWLRTHALKVSYQPFIKRDVFYYTFF